MGQSCIRLTFGRAADMRRIEAACTLGRVRSVNLARRLVVFEVSGDAIPDAREVIPVAMPGRAVAFMPYEAGQ